ncbi:hypothetical protein B9K05_08050 [Acetobacter syzygii]|uniref:Uncharacterized protein n=1 Tax=Acetobacter syzygii TaxID=146476 RepID=A0A270BKY4_9PROT|nr:hypothetical protein B9K05_08050 [Acetobacter syzygii]PAL25808.1 hypothetical protein B9K04_07545 [Acetobacter syzygii]
MQPGHGFMCRKQYWIGQNTATVDVGCVQQKATYVEVVRNWPDKTSCNGHDVVLPLAGNTWCGSSRTVRMAM